MGGVPCALLRCCKGPVRLEIGNLACVECGSFCRMTCNSGCQHMQQWVPTHGRSLGCVASVGFQAVNSGGVSSLHAPLSCHASGMIRHPSLNLNTGSGKWRVMSMCALDSRPPTCCTSRSSLCNFVEPTVVQGSQKYEKGADGEWQGVMTCAWRVGIHRERCCITAYCRTRSPQSGAHMSKRAGDQKRKANTSLLRDPLLTPPSPVLAAAHDTLCLRRCLNPLSGQNGRPHATPKCHVIAPIYDGYTDCQSTTDSRG